eukprot:scaffold10222_cov135-Isochrysis_galbana.AAC.9
MTTLPLVALCRSATAPAALVFAAPSETAAHVARGRAKSSWPLVYSPNTPIDVVVAGAPSRLRVDAIATSVAREWGGRARDAVLCDSHDVKRPNEGVGPGFRVGHCCDEGDVGQQVACIVVVEQIGMARLLTTMFRHAVHLEKWCGRATHIGGAKGDDIRGWCPPARSAVQCLNSENAHFVSGAGLEPGHQERQVSGGR